MIDMLRLILRLSDFSLLSLKIVMLEINKLLLIIFHINKVVPIKYKKKQYCNFWFNNSKDSKYLLISSLCYNSYDINTSYWYKYHHWNSFCKIDTQYCEFINILVYT